MWTSYRACLAVSYMFSKLAFLVTHPVIASEFVEQYGRSVLAAVEHARLRAAIILGLTNVVGSTLTRSPASTSANNQAGDRGRGHQDLHLPALGARPTRLEACQEEEEDLHEEIERLEERLERIPDIAETIIRAREGR